MIKKTVFLFMISGFFSCGNESNDVYKTKGGEYASKTGNFIADFPLQPQYTEVNKQFEKRDFEINVFRSTLGPKKIFSLEYVDYPKDMIHNLTDEEVYAETIKNYTQKMASSFVLQSQKPIKQHSLSGKQFVMKLNEEAKKKGLKGFIIGRLFLRGDRIYILTFVGINDKNTDSFLNSFRLIK